MKITAIGHASILIEAHGSTLLSDPWWRGPCFGAQWWIHPRPFLEALDGRRIDYLYISHGHHDHLHPGTLRTLRERVGKVLVSAHIGIAPSLRSLGFEVLELKDEEEAALGGIAVRIMRTHGDDTLMAVSDGTEVCLNLNDALHSAPRDVQDQFVARLAKLYPRIDYVFCGYGVASHFPNCYEIPGKDREATAARRQAHFNRSWAGLVASLAPRFGFPFAADVVFLQKDLFWVNEPTHNAERPTRTFERLFPASASRVMDIAPGFSIEGGRVLNGVFREPVSARALEEGYPEEIARANRGSPSDAGELDEVLALIRANLESCRAYLEGHPRDYRFLIELQGTTSGIVVEKRATRVSVDIASSETREGFDLVYRTRLPYLRWVFTMPYGDELLFVGSGGTFRYASRELALQNIHRELKVLLTPRERALPARPEPPNRALTTVKRAIKRAIGKDDIDLYDLAAWTVWQDAREASAQ
ncbi:MAG TPA: MBL fold metallo-hydrolase [Casimicrobiaceae bacterium]